MQSSLQWLGLFVAGGCGVCLRFVVTLRIDTALAERYGARMFPFAGRPST